MGEAKHCDYCDLPIYCPMCCTCLAHCAGTTTANRAWRYFRRTCGMSLARALSHWWATRSWKPRQGCWYVQA